MVNTWLVDTLPSDFSRFFPSTSLFLSHIFFPQFFFQFFFFKEKSVTGFFSHFCFFYYLFWIFAKFFDKLCMQIHPPFARPEQAQPEEKSKKMRITQGKVRMDSGCLLRAGST